MFEEDPPLALVRYPRDVSQPVIVTFTGIPIEIAICSWESLDAKVDLEQERWSALGVYVLLGDADPETHVARARPGTTQTKPLLERLQQHLDDREKDDKDWWTKAILVRRINRPFDNAETGYLEALLHKAVDDAVYTELHPDDRKSNYAGPSSNEEARHLETEVLLATKVAMGLAGMRLETEQEMERLTSLQSRRRSDEQLHD